jgi:hypothetical protein
MTLPRTVADVLSDHVAFEVECIDRMYCNVYVPQLQRELGLIGYLREQLGCTVNSTAPLAPVTEAFSAAVGGFARDHGIPLVDFARGQRKDDVLHQHLAGFTGTEGVLFIGRAQEKAKFVPHREAPRRGGGVLSVDRPGHGAGGPAAPVHPRRPGRRMPL